MLPDANGQVTKGSELFGNNTVLPDGTLAPNGFAALAAFDGNHDGVIDAKDPVFSQLRLWVGGNGQPGSGQLLTLAEAGIQSLNLTYSAQNITDANGNQIRQVGSYSLTNGTTRAMDDVWYGTDTAQTVDVSHPVAVSSTIAALPNLAGAGNVHSLQQAMAADTSGKLESLVQAFAAAAGTMTPDQARAAAEAVLLDWTGADRHSATSRGAYIDGRELYAVEAFMGQGFSQGFDYSNPGPVAAIDVKAAYSKLLDWTTGQLLAQTKFAPWLNQVSLTWDAATNRLGLDVSKVVTTLNGLYSSDAVQATATMLEFGQSLKGMGDVGAKILSGLQLHGSLSGTGFSRALVTLGYAAVNGNRTTATLSGVPYQDSMLLGVDGETLNAGNGDDMLVAGGGHETLNAGSGNDTFVFNRGSGQVLVNEAATKTAITNQDVLRLGDGLTPAATTATRDLSNNLILGFGNGDQVILAGYFNHGAGDPSIVFADGTTWHASDIIGKLPLGDSTAGGNTLKGATDLNDAIIGAINDTIYAGNLNDTITAGRNNHLYSGAGVDTFVFNAGDGSVVVNDSYAVKTVGVNHDVFQLGAGITASGTQVTRDLSGNLLLGFGNGDQLTVQAYFSNSALTQTTIVFADGTSWNYATVLSQAVLQDTGSGNNSINGVTGVNNTIVGAASDRIYAGNLNDTITAGKNNTLYSGTGVDTFIFAAGDGSVVLNDAYTPKTAGIDQDVMRIGAGISAAGTKAMRDLSNNLVLIFGNGDQLTVQGYFASSSLNKTSIVFADGTSWSYAKVASQLVTQDTGTGNSTIRGLSGANNTMIGATGDAIYAGNLNDVITAGKNDTLYAGAGVDTFIFNAGDGSVVLNDAYAPKTAGIDQDMMRIGAGISAAGTKVMRDLSNNLVLMFGNGDQLTVQGYFTNGTLNQTSIVFADGTNWNYAAVTSQLVVQDTGVGNNTIHGLAGVNNTMIGATGDSIFAGNLNDTITAGKNDHLYAGAGVDTFVFNAGSGSVVLNETYTPKTAGIYQDAMRIGAGISAAGTQVTRDASNNLVLLFGNGDQLTVQGYFTAGSLNKTSIVFADGTTWNYAKVASQLVQQDTGSGNTTIYGLSGVNNTMIGAAGDTIYAGNLNDTITAGKNGTLYAGAGVDTFIFNSGAGRVVIKEAYTPKMAGIDQDVMRIGAGITATGTQAMRDSSNDLVLAFGNGDQLTVLDYFGGDSTTNQTKIVFADGTHWGYADVVNRLTPQQAHSVVMTTDTSAGGKTLQGSAGVDNVITGAVGDTIYAGNLNDTITAGKSNTLYSGAGVDTFIFNAGDGSVVLNDAYSVKTAGINRDVMRVGAGITAAGTKALRDLSNNLVLVFGNGDQLTVQGYFANADANDTAIVFADGTNWDYTTVASQLVLQDTSSGNRTLSGLKGINNTIIGTTGDTIYAGNLNDTITAGKNNSVFAGAGVDTFIFTAADANVVLNETNAQKTAGIDQDVVRVGPGITADGTQVMRDLSNNLVLVFGNGDQLTVQGYFTTSSLNQTSIVFADGTSWNYAAVMSQLITKDTSSGGRTIYGLTGVNNTMIGATGDSLFAGNSNDTITAGKNDYLYSGAGIDTFVFNAGDGSVVLNDACTSKTVGIDQDVMRIGAGISAPGTKVMRDVSNNLVLVFGNGDQLTVQGYFTNTASNKTSIVFADGTSWNYAGVASQLVLQDTSSGGHTLNGLSGVNNTMIGATGDTIYAGNLNDTITAGKNDYLYSGAGVDTFIFNAGDGSVVLNEAYTSKTDGINQDVMHVGAGITAAGTQVIRDASNNLVLVFGNGDQLTVQGYFTTSALNQTSIAFADGTSWNYAAVMSQLITKDTSSGGHTIYGLNGVNNTMIGAVGDSLFAGNSNDTITAGKNNFLYSGAGIDTFVFNAGDGSVVLNDAFTPKTAGINQDVMRIGAGIGSVATQVLRDLSNNLVLVFGNGDQLTVQGYFTNGGVNATSILFADGTTWNYAGVTSRLVLKDTSSGNQMIHGLNDVNNTIIGAPGDIITAGNLNDTITAGKGDRLYAGVGRDTFIFTAGDGSVVLDEADTLKTARLNQDVMRIGAGIAAASTTVSRDLSNDLVLTFGNGDQLTVQGYFADSVTNAMSIVFADGTSWNYAAVTSRLVLNDTSSGNNTIHGLSGVDNTIIGAPGDLIYAGDQNDTITAGKNDKLFSGVGVDTFIFNAGDGSVVLNDAYTQKSAGVDQDVMRIGAGIAAAGTKVARDLSNNLILTFGNGDQLTVQGYFTSNDANKTSIVFADGTSWNYATVTSHMVLQDTSSGYNLIYGLTGVNNTMIGATGDTIYAGNLNDTITAGKNDTLNAGAGVDLFEAGAGCGAVNINEAAKTNVSNQDRLLVNGVDQDQLWFKMSGSNLVIDIMGTSDHITLNNWASSSNQLATIEVENGAKGQSLLSASAVNQLVQAMASFSANNTGFDPTSPTASTITDPNVLLAVNSSWHQ